ncbi:hypothetical protein ACIGB6_02070 [Paeniglutamicibacter gangotriensis]|nr:hypothetical protein [Paeniglutamicibacter gangotriensis]KAA0979826.1 hypothetical protein FQ154_01300 [Paeniglutamicibacter gangotriensis]
MSTPDKRMSWWSQMKQALGAGAHVDIAQWVAVTREDGETVGWIQPLDSGFDTVQARSVLGHALGGPVDYMAAEEALLERGIGELAGPWQLDRGTAAVHGDLSIGEVSAHGIVLADAMLVKALVPCPRFTVPWPYIGR